MEVKKRYVGQPVVKKDAKALLSGHPVYTDDQVPEYALTVKLMRSPHAFAKVKAIDTSKAMLVPGIEIILTYKDVPKNRFTLAGQTFPETRWKYISELERTKQVNSERLIYILYLIQVLMASMVQLQ